MSQAPRDVEPAPAPLPVGPDEQPAARPVAPGGMRRVVTGVGVGVAAGLLVLLDLRRGRDGAGRVEQAPWSVRARGRR